MYSYFIMIWFTVSKKDHASNSSFVLVISHLKRTVPELRVHILTTLQCCNPQLSIWHSFHITLLRPLREELEKRTMKPCLDVNHSSAIQRWREGLVLLPGVPNPRERLGWLIGILSVLAGNLLLLGDA